MKKPKKSIQEHILGLLSRSRATRHDEVIEQVEALIELENDQPRKVKPRYLITRTLRKMIDEQMIQEHDSERSVFLSLNPQGRHKLRTLRLSSQSHLISTNWDGFWRIIIVDIPESRKSDQDAIRYVLKKAQFIQIKNSVWISPYPLEHLMINMKKDMGFEEEIIVLVSDKLDAGTEQLLIQKFSKKEGS